MRTSSNDSCQTKETNRAASSPGGDHYCGGPDVHRFNRGKLYFVGLGPGIRDK